MAERTHQIPANYVHISYDYFRLLGFQGFFYQFQILITLYFNQVNQF